MAKIVIDGFMKKIGIFLFLLVPEIVRANPIVSFDLYSPFSTREYYQSYLLMILIGLILEILVIYQILKKNIDKTKMLWAILVIFIPIGILNFFTMLIVQVLATFLAFFAEIFPIVVEFLVLCVILKIANKKNILLVLPSKKNIFKIVLLANFVSFVFGLLINIGYSACSGNKTLSGYCKAVSEKTSTMDKFVYDYIHDMIDFKNGTRIKECDKLSDVWRENQKYSEQFKCYLNYAIKKNDIKFCYLTERYENHYVQTNWGGSYDKENICDTAWAIEKKDYELCVSNGNRFWGQCLDEELIIPHCYYEIAIAKNESAGCDKIKSFFLYDYNGFLIDHSKYSEDGLKKCSSFEEKVKEVENKCYSEIKNN